MKIHWGDQEDRESYMFTASHLKRLMEEEVSSQSKSKQQTGNLLQKGPKRSGSWNKGQGNNERNLSHFRN